MIAGTGTASEVTNRIEYESARGLGNGTDVDTAFQLGCFQIGTHFLDEHTTPQIMWKNDEPKKIIYLQNGDGKHQLELEKVSAKNKHEEKKDLTKAVNRKLSKLPDKPKITKLKKVHSRTSNFTLFTEVFAFASSSSGIYMSGRIAKSFAQLWVSERSDKDFNLFKDVVWMSYMTLKAGN